MTKADLDELRNHFSEEETFDIVVIICFFNFMDRIADSFGVELDPMLEHTARHSPEGEAIPHLSARSKG